MATKQTQNQDEVIKLGLETLTTRAAKTQDTTAPLSNSTHPHPYLEIIKHAAHVQRLLSTFMLKQKWNKMHGALGGILNEGREEYEKEDKKAVVLQTHVWLCVPQIEPQVDEATADQQQQFYIY